MDDSVFSTRLGTNYTATEQEIIQLNTLLVEPMAKLAELQKDVECARLIHIDLCNQHDALSRQIEAHRALMAPIRRLPVDVIRDIFLQCLPTKYNSFMSKHAAPMLLTQVCSGWRSIAHSTPSLWASIHIVFARNRNPITLHPYQVPVPVVDSPLFLVGQNRARGVKEWLSRSGACRLDISIYDISDTDRDVDATCHEIIDSLIAVSTRWGSVDLHISTRFLERFAALLVSDVPILHSLSIPENFNFNVMGPPGGPIQWGPTSLWKDSGLLKAPRLRQISYNKLDDIANSSESFAAFPLKWPQLTTISFVVASGWDTDAPETTFSNIVTILRSCTALVNCTVEMRIGYVSDHVASSERAINMATVSLLYLEQLYVNLGVNSLHSLCRVLEAPALQHLEVFTDIQHLSDSCTAQLLLFLARCGTGANMRRLTVNPLNFTKARFIQLMETCPNLNALCLKSCPSETIRWGPGVPLGSNGFGYASRASPLYGVDDDLLRSVCAVAEGPLYEEDQIHGGALLQKLTTFECLIGGKISDDAILDFVTAKRLNGVLAPLQRITMALDRPRTMISMVDKLRPFVADGLKCEISYAKPIPPSATFAYEGIPSFSTNQGVGDDREFLDF